MDVREECASTTTIVAENIKVEAELHTLSNQAIDNSPVQPALRRSLRKRQLELEEVADQKLEVNIEEALVTTEATSSVTRGRKKSSGPGPSRENSSSPNKKRKQGYASPKKYAHLKPLDDRLLPELDVVFCGINPGEVSAKIGFHFGNPTNKFWRCLHESGFTPTLLKPQEGPSLPERFRLGLTDLVERPTASSCELSDAEKAAAVPGFLAKIHRSRPRILCFLGLEISRIVTAKACDLPTSKCSKIPAGLLPFKLVYSDTLSDGDSSTAVRETLFFASPSPSGLNAGYGKDKMVKVFSEVKDLLKQVKEGTYDSSTIKPISLLLVDEITPESGQSGEAI